MLKEQFIKAYKRWVNERNWQQREIYWIEYCLARDAYMGFSLIGYLSWQKGDSDATTQPYDRSSKRHDPAIRDNDLLNQSGN